jgi:hypothetical protein
VRRSPLRGLASARQFIEAGGRAGRTPCARSDGEIADRNDDIVTIMLERYGRTWLSNDTAWLERFAWIADACDRA